MLGVKSTEDIDWYLQPPHFEKLLSRLVTHLDKVAQIVLHFSCAVSIDYFDAVCLHIDILVHASAQLLFQNFVDLSFNSIEY